MADWGYREGEDDATSMPNEGMDAYIGRRLMNPGLAPTLQQTPTAPNLTAGADPAMQRDMFRNTMFDKQGLIRQPDGSYQMGVDPVASEQNRLAAQQGLQDLITQQMFEARTGYANPKAQKAARWANFAGGVFDNFIAPAASAFGGLGGAEGVNEYLKGVSKQAEQRQADVDARRHNSLTSLKTVMDMMGKTSKFSQDNIDNYFSALKTAGMMQESQARAMQATQGANANAMQAYNYGDTARSRQIQDVMDRQKQQKDLERITGETRAQQSLADYRDQQAKTEGAKRSLIGRQGQAEIELGKKRAQDTLLSEEKQKTERAKQGYLGAREDYTDRLKVGEPIKDNNQYIKSIPARWSDGKGLKLAQELAEAIKDREGVTLGEAQAKALALLKNREFKAKEAEKKKKKGSTGSAGAAQPDKLERVKRVEVTNDDEEE